MGFIKKHWELDGRDGISFPARLILSIIVTGITGFLLEYIGIYILDAFQNTDNTTIYLVIGIWALGLGPLLVLFRKSSMLVPMAIVSILFAFLVLFNHFYFIEWEFSNGEFIDTGILWSNRIWEFREGAIFGLTNPLLIALAAGIIESIVVPVSIWTQKLLTLSFKPKEKLKLEDTAELFSSSVTPKNKLKQKRDFGFYFMRFIFIAYGAYFSYQIIGLIVHGKGMPLMSMFFLNPPETINTFMKITLMLTLANLAAFNKTVRREAAMLLTFGHLISVGASLLLYLYFDPNPLFPGDHSFLLASVAGDGVLIIILLYYVVGPKAKLNFQLKTDIELRSPASTLMKYYYLVFGILFSVYTISIVYFRFLGNAETGLGAVFGGPDPLVSNSLTKYGTLAIIGFFLYKKVSLRKYFAPTLIIAFSVSIFATFIYGLMGTTIITTRFATAAELPWFMVWHIIVDGLALFILLVIRRFQYHSDFQITSLKPGSAECIMSLHEALRSDSHSDKISAREVLSRIDEHIAEMKGRKRGLLSFPFWLIEYIFPLILWFRPQFSLLSVDEQKRMLRRYILRPYFERPKSSVPFLADFFYQIGDVSNTLVTLVFFSSPNGAKTAGYIYPDARERLQSEMPDRRPPEKSNSLPYPASKEDPNWLKPASSNSNAANRLLAPGIGMRENYRPIPDEIDYCIIGSGAAGGVLAYRLSQLKGEHNSICVLERGGHYSPRQDFTGDELRMIRTLYTEGGLQNTRAFDFTILQGECVGGTSVINNAICIKMPEVSSSEWEKFGIEIDALESHYERVKQEMNIGLMSDNSVNKKVEELFIKGVTGYNSNFTDEENLSAAERLSGNFRNCVGCGLCNIGCKRMRKMSVLETYIPWCQGLGVNIYSNTGAVKCETQKVGDKKKVTAVIVRTADGSFKKIKINKALIVSAGAVASSRFLMRSKVGGNTVGQNLACNFAIPPLVEFDEEVNAYDGAQITMFALPESNEMIFETSFNPPGAYSITFPIQFNIHAQLMQAYTRSANFTALVGSDPSGSISNKRDIMFGRAINWDQTKNDMLRVRKALITCVRIAKAAGGKRIYLPTNPGLVIDLDSETEKKLEQFQSLLTDKKHFNFVTAHPQGGNMMASDSFAERVVDIDFRAKDCDNLFVCDASVFPRGIRVNPQWTIMALASSAAEKIAAST